MAAHGTIKPGDLVTESGTTYRVVRTDSHPTARTITCEKQDGTVRHFRFAEAAVTLAGSDSVVHGGGTQALYYNR